MPLEPILTAFAAHSRRGWLEDLAQCHALAALPDTRDGAVGSGTPPEALGCKRICFQDSGTTRKIEFRLGWLYSANLVYMHGSFKKYCGSNAVIL